MHSVTLTKDEVGHMYTLYCAFSAGEFLDESLSYNELPDGIEYYNPNSPNHPYEWWILI